MIFHAEFDLVKNAMYTDPNDQSVWIYHRWLIGPGEHPPAYALCEYSADVILGDNQSIVEREIVSIQELLEEQPDSKCECCHSFCEELCAYCLNSGCMESLVFYKRLLVHRYGGTMEKDQRLALERECAELLDRLQSVDPDRRQRYIDMCKSPIYPSVSQADFAPNSS